MALKLEHVQSRLSAASTYATLLYETFDGQHKSQANRQQRAGVDASHPQLLSREAPDMPQVHTPKVSPRQDRLRYIRACPNCRTYGCVII